MRVANFMKPADKVITVASTDTIRKALDLMLEHKIGAIVVLATGTEQMPVGIVTKTHLVKAYHEGTSTLDHHVKEIMATGEDELVTCHETTNRDDAARILERHQTHHAIVVDPNTQHLVGLISSWDITVECAKDDRAWPWNRSEDGKFHKPNESTQKHEEDGGNPEMASSPDSVLHHLTSNGHPNYGDSFREYIDNLVYFD